MTHARLAPSDKCWPNCPGSVREQANYPDISGEAAIDGTGTHLLIELCFENNCQPEDYIGQIIGHNHPEQPMGWLIDEERAQRAEVMFIYLKARREQYMTQYPGCTIEVISEGKFNPGEMFGRKDWYGTCDVSIIVRDQDGNVVALEISDYKDGRLWVPEQNNSQLQSYGLGLANHVYDKGRCTIGDVPFRLGIVQPKVSKKIRYEDTTYHELLKVGNKLSNAARATDDPDAPLIADGKDGKGYCRWCDHRKNCPALAAQKQEKLNVMIDDTQIVGGEKFFELLAAPQNVIESLPSEKLAELLDAEGAVMATFKTVNDVLEKRLKEGEDLAVYGYGYKPGKMSRVWAEDEETIVKMLKGKRLKKEEIYPSKLASPAQILKSTNLTKEQKEKIEDKFIVEKFGAEKLGKVPKKEVKPAASLFDQVPEMLPEPQLMPEVSFFSADIKF